MAPEDLSRAQGRSTDGAANLGEVERPRTPVAVPTALASAQRSILAEETLASALEAVVRHACSLTGATHGSVDVVGPYGSLQGSHPYGALVTTVDIVRRDALLGVLQVVQEPGGGTPVNAAILQLLTGTAALLIENFQLAADNEQRDTWVRASTEITRTLLSSGNDHTLRDVAGRLRDLIDADIVKVVLPVPGADRMRIHVSLTRADEALAGEEYPSRETLSGVVIETGEPVRLADVREVAGAEVHPSDGFRVGPVLSLPLVVAGRPRGALVIGRSVGRDVFSPAESELATAFAGQAALALELVDTRAAQDRMAQREDRSRIARDLHDVVIQQLFATGLTVRALIRPDTAPRSAQGLEQVIDDLDGAISQIRSSIFALEQETTDRTSTRSVVLSTVALLADALGRAPRIRFSGPVDTLTPAGRHGDVRAVLGELLANVARHARAKQVDVDVTVAAGWLRIRVTDDGVGMVGATRDSGLANLRSRAVALHGRVEVETTSGGGTTVLWTIPLDAAGGA